MFTCKIKVGTEWNLPTSIKRQDKADKWRTIKGRKMNDIKELENKGLSLTEILRAGLKTWEDRKREK